MHPALILLAAVGVLNVLALPLDFQIEATSVDARTVGRRSANRDSIIILKPTSDKLRNRIRSPDSNHSAVSRAFDAITHAESYKRFVNPYATVDTSFGTECSLDTCDMYPTFPGCGRGNDTETEQEPVKVNWAQPPMRKRDALLATKVVDPSNDWEQRLKIAKREPYFSPLVGIGVAEGAGPACSIHTCDMCPNHPGCKPKTIIIPPQ